MSATPEIPEFAREMVNLASPRLGSKPLGASDQFFAPAKRMLQDTPAVFIPDKYDNHGKWMDGWESRRKRGGGHDWCIVKLGVKGVIHGVDIDTSHFTGNYPPAASLEACLSDKAPTAKTKWTPILPQTKLGPVPMLAGVHYTIELTHDSNSTAKTIRLLWSSARHPQPVIPTYSLVP